ncbi:hypothetical protein SPURM210S_07549 [Streptomyces purpurascens]
MPSGSQYARPADGTYRKAAAVGGGAGTHSVRRPHRRPARRRERDRGDVLRTRARRGPGGPQPGRVAARACRWAGCTPAGRPAPRRRNWDLTPPSLLRSVNWRSGRCTRVAGGRPATRRPSCAAPTSWSRRRLRGTAAGGRPGGAGGRAGSGPRCGAGAPDRFAAGGACGGAGPAGGGPAAGGGRRLRWTWSPGRRAWWPTHGSAALAGRSRLPARPACRDWPRRLAVTEAATASLRLATRALG